MFALDDSNQKKLRTQIPQIISPSAYQEPIHMPCYGYSLCGAWRHFWAFRLYIIEYLAIILIIHDLETMVIIYILSFTDKRRRYSRDHRAAEIWRAMP
jgi:hypothetical protein